MQTIYYRHKKLNQQTYKLCKSPISFNDLTIVLKGELHYQINDKDIIVKSGDCLFLNAGTVRQRTPIGQSEYVSFNFYGNTADLPLITHDVLSEEIKLLLMLCDEIYQKHYDWCDKIDCSLLLIIKLLQDKLKQLEETPMVISIKKYIRENLKKQITLKNIADFIGYSPNHCNALFKEKTGFSIIQFLIQERISEAKLLLLEGILPLKDVAESVGFLDYNYFSRTFKKQTGNTPLEFKLIRHYK